MFTKQNRPTKPSTTDTLIGQESTVEGKIICKASLRIEGKVNGDVECAGDVTLGKEAVVYSTITARNVINSGTIHGAIRSNGALTIANTGKMYGDIAVGSLSIATGGVFEGMSKMIQTMQEATAPEDSLEVSGLKPRLHKIEGTNQNSNQGTAQIPSSTKNSGATLNSTAK